LCSSLPDFIASFTDPVAKAVPWLHPNPVVNQVWLNTGSGWGVTKSFTVPYGLDAVRWEPKALVQLVDVNGDGLPDIVLSKGTCPKDCSRTWVGTGAGWVERANWRVPVEAIGTSDGDPGFRLVDTKGDGFP
jgi:hypothetical protein